VGSIALPASGSVYVDANAIICAVDKNATYWPLLKPVWQAGLTGSVRLTTSALSLLEVLVGPTKKGDAALVATYDGLLHSPDMDLVPIDELILREAVRLRAAVGGLRTPDALHAATGLLHSATIFITNDSKFRKVPGLPVTVLSDLLSP